MSALCAQKSLARCGERFEREFVETRDEPRVSRGGFRILRDAAQGAALRTRSLSRKADESFSRGAVLP